MTWHHDMFNALMMWSWTQVFHDVEDDKVDGDRYIDNDDNSDDDDDNGNDDDDDDDDHLIELDSQVLLLLRCL